MKTEVRCHDNSRDEVKKKQNFLLWCLLTLNKSGSGHCKKENSLLSATTQEPCQDNGNPSLVYNVSYNSPATPALDERGRESFTTPR
jgi:hypothetical protein